MIYTVTFNPSLDYIVRTSRLEAGCINRTHDEQILAGGKGINVSIVLNNLGQSTQALGFVAGFTGQEIIRQLDTFGVSENFIRLAEGLSRINVKVKGQEEETEINGAGPSRYLNKQRHSNSGRINPFFLAGRHLPTNHDSSSPKGGLHHSGRHPTTLNQRSPL